MRQIAVLGTGLMGTAVAGALVRGGFDVTVWNRTSANMEAAIQAGASAAKSPGAAIKTCDAVILLMQDHVVARQALRDDNRLHGKDIIDLMTAGPDIATEFSAEVNMLGGAYLKGAIQSFPSAIGSSDALIYISGDWGAWRRQEAAVMTIAPSARYFGPGVEASALIDAALSGAFATVAIGAWLEALAFVMDAGLDLSSDDIDWWARQLAGDMKQILLEAKAADYSTGDATLTVHAAALSQWRQVLIRRGHRAGIATAALHNMELALAGGHGDASWAAQLEILRRKPIVGG